MSTPSKLPVTVYTPDSSLSNPFVMIRAMFADLWKGRELAWRLTVRDISAQYRQTFLGILWALILPLANTVVWLYLNLTGIVVLQETPIPYPVYVFAGTMLWAIFMDSINAPMSQTGGAIGMLTKLNFPREALLLAGIYKTLFNSGIKLVLMLCILPFFDVNPGWGLTLFPLGVFFSHLGRHGHRPVHYTGRDALHRCRARDASGDAVCHVCHPGGLCHAQGRCGSDLVQSQPAHPPHFDRPGLADRRHTRIRWLLPGRQCGGSHPSAGLLDRLPPVSADFD